MRQTPPASSFEAEAGDGDLRVCVLGSGSSGNCVFVGNSVNGLLIDAGLSGRETLRRLSQAGISADAVKAICVSHEHGDHTTALGVLHRRRGAELYANSGTIDGLRRDRRLQGVPWKRFTNGHSFTVGSLEVTPFSVPHDAYDPVGFRIEQGGRRVGVVTDMGIPTTLIRERLRNCDALVLEFNHDDELLQRSSRPWSLKQRIRGRQGHLSNRHAAAILSEVAGKKLQHVFAAHMSRECNRPHLVLKEAHEALGGSNMNQVTVSCSYPDRISHVWTAAINAPRAAVPAGVTSDNVIPAMRHP